MSKMIGKVARGEEKKRVRCRWRTGMVVGKKMCNLTWAPVIPLLMKGESFQE